MVDQVGGVFGMVQHRHHGDPLRLQQFQPFDQGLAGMQIERGGRFVEQSEAIRADQRARQVDLLLLAAGKGCGIG